jgi:hypothetical protein
MPVDGGPDALAWLVWTGGSTVGAMRGAQFVDSWTVIETEVEGPQGCVALASTRTPYVNVGQHGRRLRVECGEGDTAD